MPYADSQMRKAVVRESQRRRRSGVKGKPSEYLSTPGPTTLEHMRIHRTQDLLDLLEEQVNVVRATMAEPLVKARTIGYLINIGARLLESRDLEDRIKALEQVLKERGASEDERAETILLTSDHLGTPAADNQGDGPR